MTLDPVAARLASQWGFWPTEELPGGHCSHVYASHDRVLKIPYQGEEMDSGFWAITRLQPPYGLAIFESDSATGSILMERAIPGSKLHESGISPSEQTDVWRGFALEFRKLPVDRMMTMSSYYSDSKDPLVEHLIVTTESTCTLHGDLHHENILRHGDGWVCIDAKGLIGDPAVEGAAFVCNPIDEIGGRSSSDFAIRVCEVADALGVEPFRVWAWSVARMREEIPSVDEPWYRALVALYACALDFGGEQWVQPLA